MKEKDIKLLWGRAANHCSLCRCELSQDAKASQAAFTLGEQAHIVGEKEDAARGKSSLSEDERDSYHNRILLCPNHHTEIDKNEVDWPIERLHLLKSTHELWVRETLGDTADLHLVARQVAIATIIDSAVTLCRLENWKAWTSWALAPNPQWDATFPEQLFDFRQRVIAAVWPDDCEELKRATMTLSIVLNNAANSFLENADANGDVFTPRKFYQTGHFNPEYDRDAERYDAWLDACYSLVRDATRAANWFADVVRRDLNPMFFVARGKFMVVEGPFEDLSFRASVLEYTDEEKARLPIGLKRAQA